MGKRNERRAAERGQRLTQGLWRFAVSTPVGTVALGVKKGKARVLAWDKQVLAIGRLLCCWKKRGVTQRQICEKIEAILAKREKRPPVHFASPGFTCTSDWCLKRIRVYFLYSIGVKPAYLPDGAKAIEKFEALHGNWLSRLSSLAPHEARAKLELQ
mgnify:CR=1 FL=1